MSCSSIALLGISGVGKSTFLKSLNDKAPFVHAEASTLIKDEIMRQAQESKSSEELRVGNTDKNQQLLISAYKRLTDNSSDRVVLGSHSIIDKGTHVDKVEIEVFRQLGFDLLIVLVADPKKIAKQRQKDQGRTRPQLALDKILVHQNLSNEHAIAIAYEMGIPCVIISQEQVDFVAELLS